MTKKPKVATVAIALNLRKVFDVNMSYGVGIMKEDIAPQDLSFMDAKLERLNKIMKGHPLRNRDWDPEQKTIMLAHDTPPTLDPKTSRQVRRQVERLLTKSLHGHFDKNARKDPKTGLQIVEYHERIVRMENPETKLISHGKAEINRPTVTRVYTGRYVPSQRKKVAA